MAKLRKTITGILVNAELVIMALIVLIPVILIILSSFNPGNNLAGTSLIPSELTLDNYKKLFSETQYVNWFLNTLKIAVTSTICSIIVVMITSWIMSRFNFKGKKTGLMTILLLSMFPSFLSMTAIYTLFLNLGLVGKPISIVIIYVAGAIPYNTWLVKGYLDGIPKSLDEAAYLDGCSKFQSFFKIIIPMSKPIITYCAVSQFMLPWMDYILPNILLSKDESKTIALGLYNLIVNTDKQFTLFAAGAVVIAVPITIVFMLFQKYLVKGISAGANKG